MKHHVHRRTKHTGHRFQPNLQVFGVIAAPVKALGATKPLLLARPPELLVLRTKLKHGDFVGIRIRHQPFIGVQAVVTGRQSGHDVVDGTPILQGAAHPDRQRSAFGLEAGLVDRGFHHGQPTVIHVKIGTTHDRAWIPLKDDPMAIFRLDINPDVQEP